MIKVAHGFHHVPAVLLQRQALEPFGAAVEQRQSFRTQHPFVAVSHDEIGLAGLYIEWFYAQTLYGVHAECYIMLPAGGANRDEVECQSGGILNGTE